MIVHHSKPVTLIGGGALGDTDLERARAMGEFVVAADGGADAALSAGVSPDAVIGDFDSISEWARTAIDANRQHHIGEQDSTDFDKCLRNIVSPLILGVGFTGSRIDHHLANFNTLVRHPARRCILLGNRDVAFLVPPSFSLEVAAGTPVSLFPLGVVEGTSEGLKWPIGGLTFTPDGRIGTSNEATGAISLSLTAPKMLLILPSDLFESAAKALLSNASTWRPV